MHVGGYLSFSFDVTEHIHVGENTLTVKVWDNLDTEIPYGKQRKKRGGMWYTPVSGIWQNVWLESVPKNAFSALRLAAQCTDARVNLVTPALFEAYPSLDDLAAAEVSDIEGYIHSCGFYRQKAKDIVLVPLLLLQTTIFPFLYSRIHY